MVLSISTPTISRKTKKKIWKNVNQEEYEKRLQVSGRLSSVVNSFVTINKILIFAGNFLQNFLY